MSELEVIFMDNEGNLFDFKETDHSFALEIIEVEEDIKMYNTNMGRLMN